MDQHERLLTSGNFPGAYGIGLKFKTTSQRYFFFIMKPQHRAHIAESITQMMKTEWNRHFELL